MNWLERAQREIPRNVRLHTANSAERTLTAALAEAFLERAAIYDAEFDSEPPYADAEACAFACFVAEWLNRNPERSWPGRCHTCGYGEGVDNPLLPFGIERTGHVWLHSRCWPAWYAGRKAQAVAALAARCRAMSAE